MNLRGESHLYNGFIYSLMLKRLACSVACLEWLLRGLRKVGFHGLGQEHANRMPHETGTAKEAKNGLKTVGENS